MTIAVYNKSKYSESYTIDVSKILNNTGGETITSASVLSYSPIVAGFSTSVTSKTATTFTLAVTGGLDKDIYGIRINLVTNLRTFQETVAVSCFDSVSNPFQQMDPYGFRYVLDEVRAGESVLGKGTFFLPAGTDVTNGSASWVLLDSTGRTYGSGSCFDFVVKPTSFQVTVEASSVIVFSSDLPETSDSHQYQIRWTLTAPNGISSTCYENIRVNAATSVPLGTFDAVEMAGDPFTLFMGLATPYDNVSFSIYDNDTLVYTADAKDVKKTASGWMYSGTVNPTNFSGRMEPYVVSWKFFNNDAPALVMRETSRLFVFTPSLLNAVEDIRTRVQKARTNALDQPDIIFDTATLCGWLRRGRDWFNAAGGFITNFTMIPTTTNPAVRELWLWCAEIEALRSHALAEGEKAFDFQGQEISLSVNKVEYYKQLADDLETRFNESVRPLKQNLLMKGDTGTAKPSVGISYSPLIRYPGTSGWLRRW